MRLGPNDQWVFKLPELWAMLSEVSGYLNAAKQPVAFEFDRNWRDFAWLRRAMRQIWSTLPPDIQQRYEDDYRFLLDTDFVNWHWVAIGRGVFYAKVAVLDRHGFKVSETVTPLRGETRAEAEKRLPPNRRLLEWVSSERIGSPWAMLKDVLRSEEREAVDIVIKGMDATLFDIERAV